MIRRGRIAVLFHEKDRSQPPQGYIVHRLADYWREWGHAVFFIYGVRHFEPVDLLFVHVDLSVVPSKYLEFASRYPATVNARISDIRKSRISTNIVSAIDEWRGPVIVKSDLNCGGMPEQARSRSRWPLVRELRAAVERLGGKGRPFQGADDYEIYEELSLVPSSRASDRRLVIERFLPEFESGVYYTRVYQFLGNSWICLRIGSRCPIVKAKNSVSVERVEPHPIVDEWRKKLDMDYGKFDYVMVDGQPVLFDANKTIGASSSGMNELISSEQVESNRRTLAEGIYAYL
jgi:hypothetical protein